MTGLELARRVQQTHAGIRFILVSGYAEQLGEEELSQIPNCDFIAKPYQVAALLAAVSSDGRLRAVQAN